MGQNGGVEWGAWCVAKTTKTIIGVQPHASVKYIHMWYLEDVTRLGKVCAQTLL